MLVGTVGFLPVPVIAQLFPRFAPAFFSSPAPIEIVHMTKIWNAGLALKERVEHPTK
jgi:hypothetical protein